MEWVILNIFKTKTIKSGTRYTISFDTFVLQPVTNGNGRSQSTHIIEKDQFLQVPQSPFHIIKKACIDYNTTYETTRKSSKLFLYKNHKLPIFITQVFGVPLIYLPTMSADSEHNSWIALHAIRNFKGNATGCTIYLINGLEIKIDVSENTFNRQYSLATLLQNNFYEKQNQLIGHSSRNHMNTRFFTLKNRP